MCQRRRQSVRGPLRLPEAVDSKFLRQFIVAGWEASCLGYFVKVVMIGSIKSMAFIYSILPPLYSKSALLAYYKLSNAFLPSVSACSPTRCHLISNKTEFQAHRAVAALSNAPIVSYRAACARLIDRNLP